MIADGLADYVNERTISLVVDHPGRRDVTAVESPHSSIATLDSFKHFPVIHPVKLITDFSKTPRRCRSKWYRNGKVINILRAA